MKKKVTRANGRVRSRRTVYLPPPMDKALALYCVNNEIEASDVVAAALGAWLPDTLFVDTDPPPSLV